MSIFFRNYDKPGPGIDPDTPEKRSFFRFFDIFFRKLSHFSRANLLYSVTLIPTYIIVFFVVSFIMLNTVGKILGTQDGADFITIALSVIFTNFYISVMGAGPATAGMTYIMRNFAREEHAWIGSDFKDSAVGNFKQSIIVFVIDIVATVVVFYAIYIYGQISGVMAYLKYFLYVFSFIYMVMHMYIYPIMITFKLSVKDIYKNSLIFTLGKLPSNLFVMIVLFFVHIVIPILILYFGGKYFVIMLIIYVIAEIAILMSFTQFLVNFNVYAKIKTYMLDVIEEENAKQDTDSDAE